MIKALFFTALIGFAATCQAQDKNLGVGAKPVDGAEVTRGGGVRSAATDHDGWLR